jgi:hydrogenase maturation factor
MVFSIIHYSCPGRVPFSIDLHSARRLGLTEDYLKTGKLQSEFLQRLLGKIDIPDKRVVIGPGIGEDAAAIDMGDLYLIVKCDPITFVQDRIGWYAVNINANDIAAMGGKPRWFLVTMLLPEEGTTTTMIETIMHDLQDSCKELGISLIGGHTEVTRGLRQPILSGTMLGEAEKTKLIQNSNIGKGDLLYLTRGVAIEATSIIAREKRDEVIARFGEDFYNRCLRFIEDPGISVMDDARRIRDAEHAPSITGMHDPTEGGVLMGGCEMAAAAGVGLVIDTAKVPVYEETRLLCDHFSLSPHGLIASGALLVAVNPADRERLESLFNENGISLIGEFLAKGEGTFLLEGEKRVSFQPSARDEITRLFD